MKGIIVGGGIGGLTTAIALHQQNISVRVYEAVAEIKNVGAGILLGVNAMQVLQRLGLADKIQAAGNVLSAGFITDETLRPIQGLPLKLAEEKYGIASTAIHRYFLQKNLYQALPKQTVQLGKRCKKIIQDANKVTVYFEDGTKDIADFVIGADGIHSAVRKNIFPNRKIRYSGQTCWRGVTNYTLPKPYNKQITEAWGKGKRLAAIGLTDSLTYWFALEKTARDGKDNKETLLNDVIHTFSPFSSLLLEVVKSTPADKILRNDILDLAPSKNWCQGRICLIGDAAHATTPNLGQGGAQAIEDGLAIALCLAKQPTNITQAFQTFVNLRQAKANMIVNRSWTFGKIAHWENPLACGIRNWISRHTPEQAIVKNLASLYELNY